jgi:hypothetical protein
VSRNWGGAKSEALNPGDEVGGAQAEGGSLEFKSNYSEGLLCSVVSAASCTRGPHLRG